MEVYVVEILPSNLLPSGIVDRKLTETRGLVVPVRTAYQTHHGFRLYWLHFAALFCKLNVWGEVTLVTKLVIIFTNKIEYPALNYKKELYGVTKCLRHALYDIVRY